VRRQFHFFYLRYPGLGGRPVLGKAGMTIREYLTEDYEKSRGILLILNILMNVSEDDSLRASALRRRWRISCRRNLVEIMISISLYPHLSHFGICLRSSVKEITAINTSILLGGLLHSVSWYRENYPGLVLVLSDMTRLWQRRSRKKEPILESEVKSEPKRKNGFTLRSK